MGERRGPKEGIFAKFQYMISGPMISIVKKIFSHLIRIALILV